MNKFFHYQVCLVNMDEYSHFLFFCVFIDLDELGQYLATFT